MAHDDNIITLLVQELGAPDAEATPPAGNMGSHLLSAIFNETTPSACETVKAKPVAFTEPVVILTGAYPAVLIPGEPTAAEAVTAAHALMHAYLNATNKSIPLNGYLDVHEPDYWVTYACTAEHHDTHPTLAPDGPATPGAGIATLVTYHP